VIVTHTSLVLAGRYRLDGRIAAGGVGEVWRAADLVLGRPVAVKLLRPGFAQHPETLARFEAEARHAASVAHPGIAQVYDYGEAGTAESPYLVLELVDGPSLAGVLAAGPLDPGRTMDVLAQAADGLAAAHAAGLVHRDIKPANLLVGPGGQVKITDFGIAYAAGSAPITRTGMLVGTPAYLAPERAGGSPATPASDLYSLGIVGYECLTGRPPFTGIPLEVAVAHRQRELPPLPPDVPAGVAELIGQLTAKDPQARPGSAGEVARRAGQLRDALAGGTAAVLADGATAVLTDGTTQRDPMPATLIGPPAPRRSPAPPGSRRDRGRPRRAALAVVGAVLGAGLAAWLIAAAFAAAPSSQHRPGTARAAAPTPSTRPTPGSRTTPAARTVEVNAAALTGERTALAVQRLRRLGLRPHVVWTPDGGQPPGTVISVRPSGQVRAGSAVTLTAAFRPPGHRPGHGHGHGHGGGDGQGNGGGGD
jgi:eukaryotic-like serine/threonine-protein kinase